LHTPDAGKKKDRLCFRYTSKKNPAEPTGYTVYAIVLSWPENNQLLLGAPLPSDKTTVTLIGYEPQLRSVNLIKVI